MQSLRNKAATNWSLLPISDRQLVYRHSFLMFLTLIPNIFKVKYGVQLHRLCCVLHFTLMYNNPWICQFTHESEIYLFFVFYLRSFFLLYVQMEMNMSRSMNKSINKQNVNILYDDRNFLLRSYFRYDYCIIAVSEECIYKRINKWNWLILNLYWL